MRPPRLAAQLLDALLPRELRDDVLGDLQEGFVARRATRGRSAARLWYWRQALQSLRYTGGGSIADRPANRHLSKLRKVFMGFFKYDVGYALRQFRSTPGFTAVAVLSLALGIGVNSTIFTIVNGYLYKPLPVADIDEVVEIFTGSVDERYNTSSYLDYVDYRDEVDAFEGLAANMTMLYSWNRETHSETLFGELVSGNYFAVLGVQPELGRFFLDEENVTPGTHPVAVLSHGLWQSSFGGDPAVIGDTIKLNGTHFTVVGIAPPEFTGMIPVLRADVWTPLMTEPLVNMFVQDSEMLQQRGTRSLRMYGRLADGATMERALAQLQTVANRLADRYPDSNGRRTEVSVKPLREIRVHPDIDGMVTPVAGLLMGLVGLVLLVACANVANMFLARASARRREIGVRLAVGASRWRLVRQLLTESIMLSLAGGVAALLLTYWISRLVMSYRPPISVTVVLDVSPDVRVFGFTLAASLLTGVLFGLAPALRSSNPDLVATLKDDSREPQAGGLLTLRSLLVVAQVAVSLVLLVAAGLFIRSLGNAHSIDVGFDGDNVAFVTASLSAAGYDDEASRQFLRTAIEGIETVPGVVDATATQRVPMSLTNVSQGFFIEGSETREAEEEGVALEYTTVGPGYFEILGIPLIGGRGILPTDTADAPLVAVVNQQFVDQYWPGQNAIGKRIRFDSESAPWMEVVGVCGNYKMSSVGEQAQPIVHAAFVQQPSFLETILVKTAREPGPVVARLREQIAALDPDIAFFNSGTMEENLSVVLFPVRMGAALLAGFGVLALSLAAVGVYGVIAYAVSRRTHEIGIRMALGADGRDVLTSVVWHGMKAVLAGIVLGLFGALALASTLGGFLYDVSTIDPVAFLGTVVILLGVALLANYIPARRGARVDPMVALRSE